MVNSSGNGEWMQDQRRCQWLKTGELKQETESLMCAAQQVAIRENAIKIALITRTRPLYASAAKFKVSPILS